MNLLNMIGYAGLDGVTFLAFLSFLYLISPTIIPCCVVIATVVFSVRFIRKHLEARHVDIKGKYVLITGCDTGIGFALARLLDRSGFHVFATCLCDSSDGATELRNTSSSRLLVLQLDVTSDESVINCLEKVAGICGDVGLWALVNNAGTSLSGDVEIQSMSLFKLYAEINLMGVVRMCKAFLPLVRKQKGRIVNVTSVRGRIAFPTASAYVMSKHGAEGFSESLRLEMKQFGVKVIIVAPGAYGLYVGQYGKNRPVMQSGYEKMIAAVDEHLKSAYPEEYLNSYVKKLPKAYPFSEANLRGILEALESAIISENPRSRYLADGTNCLIDGNCVMARMKAFLPEYLMDSIVMWMRPLPKEAYALGK